MIIFSSDMFCLDARSLMQKDFRSNNNNNQAIVIIWVTTLHYILLKYLYNLGHTSGNSEIPKWYDVLWYITFWFMYRQWYAIKIGKNEYLHISLRSYIKVWVDSYGFCPSPARKYASDKLLTFWHVAIIQTITACC